MTDLVFHKAEQYITEDLEYYFSGERDMHSQVKPGQDIYSFTPDSNHFSFNYDDGKVGNFFFPFAPGSLDRIYIGISFPLFANNWGAAFLRHLMTLVKPDGCVVLPVYPEMQASEKNFWSRSILENLFISRSRWKGFSNIWAENDGVMSMRIGRKSPPEIESSANYLLRQGSQSVMSGAMQHNNDDSVTQQFLDLHHMHWQTMTISSVVEVIIRDHFGRKNRVQLYAAGQSTKNSLMTTDLLLSDYINVKRGYCDATEKNSGKHFEQGLVAYHQRTIKDKLKLSHEIKADKNYHVVTVIDSLVRLALKERKTLLEKAWKHVKEGGLMIVHESSDSDVTPEQLNELMTGYQRIKCYSGIVASEIKPEVEISHYSLLIEQALRDEKESKSGVFWVIQK